MNRVPGTYQNGKVVIDQLVDWPDGLPVDVTRKSSERVAVTEADAYLDGSAVEDTPEGLQRWLQWFDSLQPMLSGDDLQRFENEIRSARDAQNACPKTAIFETCQD